MSLKQAGHPTAVLLQLNRLLYAKAAIIGLEGENALSGPLRSVLLVTPSQLWLRSTHRNAGWAAAASPAVTKLTGSSGSLRWRATLTSAPLAAQGGLCTRLPAPSDPLAWRCPELGKSPPLHLPQRSHACKCSELARAPYLATKPCLLLICHPVPACRSSQTTIPRVR